MADIDDAMARHEAYLDEAILCRCGKRMARGDFITIYDDHGIYAGLWCSEPCAERQMNLHYSAQDAAENGERIDSDY